MIKGRIFAADYDHAEIARWLRVQAMRGFLRPPGNKQANARYRGQCSAGVNLPTAPNSVSLTLTRDYFGSDVDGWHLSIASVTNTGHRPYVQADVSLEGAAHAEIVFSPCNGFLRTSKSM